MYLGVRVGVKSTHFWGYAWESNQLPCVATPRVMDTLMDRLFPSNAYYLIPEERRRLQSSSLDGMDSTGKPLRLLYVTV